MKPFLLLTTREDDQVAAEEHRSYLELTGLPPEALEWWRLEQVARSSIELEVAPRAGDLREIQLHHYSGIILGGSPYTVSEPHERKSDTERWVEQNLLTLLDRIVAADFPFLGICYGVGTLGAHQGARVDRTYGEPAQAVDITLTADGQSDALFGALPVSFAGFVGHKEAITDPAPSMTVLASSATCPVQALRVGQNIYATQFHPELDTDTFISRSKAYAGHGYFNPAELTQLIAEARAADVSASHRVLSRFVEIYATAHDQVAA